MRIKSITILLVFIVVFVFGVKKSSYFSQDTTEKIIEQDDKGKVLGAIDESKTVSAPAKEVQIIWPKKPEKNKDAKDLDLGAASGLVMDCETGEIVFEKNADDVAPIASLTKIMTAMVFLEHNPGWDKQYEIKDGDIRGGGRSYLYAGDTVTAKDLFSLMLVASENTAAMALSRSTGLSDKDFVNAMNKKVEDLGLEKTFYVEPVGLDSDNISTAKELAKIVKAALDNNFVRQASTLKEYKFKTQSGQARTAQATNKLLEKLSGGIKSEGGKTGHIESSGYCFSGKFKNKEGREVVSVVLGSNGPDERFKLTEKMINWVYDNYNWK